MPETDPSQLTPYHRPIDVPLPNGESLRVYIDLYDIINASRRNQDGSYRAALPSDPAVAHAVKKLLYAGGRGGGKNLKQDLGEAAWSTNRAIELIG